MEDEIDLREYVRVLLRRWWLIAGLALVAAAAALMLNLLQPRSYEATALVAVTNPSYTLRFDPRIETVDNPNPADGACLQLATSDELLGELFAGLSPPPQGVENSEDLRDLLKAKDGTNSGLVQLTVRSREPREAASIANAWAELFIARANTLYGAAGDEQVAFFEGQAAEAQSKLAEAEQALATFQGRNQASILEARLAAAQQELRDGLAERAQTVQAMRKVQALRERVAAQPADNPVSLADELTALQLQAQALSVRPVGAAEPSASAGLQSTVADTAGAAPTIQFLLSDAALSPLPRAEELAASLHAFTATLEEQQKKLEAQNTALEPSILSLQQQLQDAQSLERRLTRERDVAQQTYTSLANKVAETRIAAQDQESGVKLASKAVVPARPAGQGTLTMTGLASALGLLVGVLAALVLEWWQSGQGHAGVAAEAGGISPDMDKIPTGLQR